ncbi:competence protein [Flavobacterium sp. K5-23]|uniref:competence protein n=1 Tax=Flavobacterium sp. K5-23 TaxID=2746225 RepID=UPI00200EEBF8|nr:competence protein [Flavobacterium sp. K5-23]UQD55585.1 competence protein [Flavobacterium sp. K5-23]
MAFEELKENAEDIQEQAKAYIETNVAFLKLWGFKMIMKSTTTILKFILILSFFLIFILFLSIAGAYALADILDSFALGFLIVAGIYLVLIILIYIFKNKIIEKPFLKKFSDIYFND